MLKMNCEKYNDATTGLLSPETPSGYSSDVGFKSDGITPDFDALFAALAHEERTAPSLGTL